MSPEKKPEVIIDPEGNEIVPALNIRPHHLKSESVKEALTGHADINELASNVSEYYNWRIEIKYGPLPYFEDVLGNPPNKELYQNGLKDYLQQLRDLPDDSFVRLDIDRDGVCKSCVIGEHCTATNYTTYVNPQDVVGAEKIETEHQQRKLERLGYQSGKDYFRRQTKHTLYNFNGNHLNNPVKNNQQEVIFESLIVRTEALRKILKS